MTMASTSLTSLRILVNVVLSGVETSALIALQVCAAVVIRLILFLSQSFYSRFKVNDCVVYTNLLHEVPYHFSIYPCERVYKPKFG